MTVLRKPMVAGNWKMNGSLALLKDFVLGITEQDHKLDVVLCVPSVYLAAASKGEFALGAQDCSKHASGAHTGDISASMFREIGVEYVIVGHSERRQAHAESNALVAEKVAQVLKVGLTPILCIGEPLEIRESNQQNEFVLEQLKAVYDKCGDEFIQKSVLAYEPIWAIGTGKTASPEQAQDVHAFIREQMAAYNSAAEQMRILYGGSVNADNAELLFAQPDIDGGLIGGASLKINDFLAICEAGSKEG